MLLRSQTGKKVKNAIQKASMARRVVFKNGKLAIAAITAAMLAAVHSGQQAYNTAMDFKEEVLQKNQKAKGEISMKKSTFVTLLVVFAAIAGALGALYFYVLRREKELDEYEQLLFSEDFNDEIPADFDEAEPEKEPEVEKEPLAKAEKVEKTEKAKK